MGIQSFLAPRLSRHCVQEWFSAMILSWLMLQIFPTRALTDEAATDLSCEYHWSPHYRTTPPLDELIGRVQPRPDACPTEALPADVENVLDAGQPALQQRPPALEAIRQAR